MGLFGISTSKNKFSRFSSFGIMISFQGNGIRKIGLQENGSREIGFQANGFGILSGNQSINKLYYVI